MVTIEEPEEIGRHFANMRRNSDGKFAPIIDTTLDTDSNTLVLVLELPNDDTIEHIIDVGVFWEKNSTLDEFLSTIKIQPENFADIEERALPVIEVDGQWQVDTANLNKYRDLTEKQK